MKKRKLFIAIAGFAIASIFTFSNNLFAQTYPENPVYMAGWNYQRNSIETTSWSGGASGQKVVNIKDNNDNIIYTGSLYGYEGMTLSNLSSQFWSWSYVALDLYNQTGNIYYLGQSDVLIYFADNPALVWGGGAYSW